MVESKNKTKKTSYSGFFKEKEAPARLQKDKQLDKVYKKKVQKDQQVFQKENPHDLEQKHQFNLLNQEKGTTQPGAHSNISQEVQVQQGQKNKNQFENKEQEIQEKLEHLLQLQNIQENIITGGKKEMLINQQEFNIDHLEYETEHVQQKQKILKSKYSVIDPIQMPKLNLKYLNSHTNANQVKKNLKNLKKQENRDENQYNQYFK